MDYNDEKLERVVSHAIATVQILCARFGAGSEWNHGNWLKEERETYDAALKLLTGYFDQKR